MVDAGSALSVQALQRSLDEALRQLLASGAPSIQEQIVPTLTAVLPQAMGNEASELSRLQGGVMLSSLRSKCLQLAQEAAAAQQAPLQYTLRGAAEPAIPRLMQVAICCQQRKLVEATHVLQILDELQDLLVVEHCLDIITWLEQHKGMLSSPAYKGGLQQLIRLCNSIHKRLGKHDVIHRARLLMLIANCTPLFDRSGVNVQAAFAPADPPPVEEVPADAVDSAGKPVDITLYKAFWKLQPLVQDATKVLKSPSEWDNLQSNLDVVLTGLAKSPATVAAVHAVGSSELAAATAAVAAAGGGSGSDGSSALYLSSYKLFGLQLADSAFRRGFLVQVLILLRTLLLPGKQPTDTLKDKARMQAVSLEGRVYRLLEATPKDGKEFAAAVRQVLRRETSWVEWKKNRNLALKGQAQAPAPAAAPGRPQPAQGCNPWDIPGLPSLSAAVEGHKQEADKQSRKRKATIEQGLELRRELADMSKVYDWGGMPFDDAKQKNKDMVRFLGGGKESALTYWCQQQIDSGAAMQPRPLMSGLKVSEQDKYPVPERVCSQLIREMDPAQGIESEYKRVTVDPVFRWRISRAVAQEAPQYEGSLITAEGLEEGMMEEAMPPAMRQNVSQQYQDAYKARKDAQKAEEAKRRNKGKPAAGAGAGAGAQKAAAGGSAPAAADGNEAAAGAAADRAAVAVKEEAGEDGATGVEETEVTEADAAGVDDADTAGAAAADGEDVGVEVKQEDEEAAAAVAAAEAAAAAVAAAEAQEQAGDAAAAAAAGDADASAAQPGAMDVDG